MKIGVRLQRQSEVYIRSAYMLVSLVCLCLLTVRPANAGERKTTGAGVHARPILVIQARPGVTRPVPNVGIYDFGNVDPLRTPHLLLTFVLKNEMKQAIAIEGLQTSCGCTSAGLADRSKLEHGDILPAGRIIEIIVAVDTSGVHRADFSNSISLFARGVSMPIATLRVNGRIQPLISYGPLEFSKDGPNLVRGTLVIKASLAPQLARILDKLRLSLVSDSDAIMLDKVDLMTDDRASDGTARRTYRVAFTRRVAETGYSFRLFFDVHSLDSKLDEKRLNFLMFDNRLEIVVRGAKASGSSGLRQTL